MNLIAGQPLVVFNESDEFFLNVQGLQRLVLARVVDVGEKK